MVHGKNRIPYRIDRRLTGLAGPEYHAIISFGLPIEPEDSQYGEYRITCMVERLEFKAREAPSPDTFVDRWEDAGECDLRSMPELCGDLRPCPAHTHSRYN